MSDRSREQLVRETPEAAMYRELKQENGQLALELEQAQKRAAQYEADHLYVEEAQAELEQTREALERIKVKAEDASSSTPAFERFAYIAAEAHLALASGAVQKGDDRMFPNVAPGVPDVDLSEHWDDEPAQPEPSGGGPIERKNDG